MGNYPPGTTEADIDRAAPVDEPEYELTEADLEEAYIEALEASAPDNEDWFMINAQIDAELELHPPGRKGVQRIAGNERRVA
jgi:hypothetical protein